MFRSEYSDLQVTQYVNNTSVINNAGSATINGVELEVTLQPTEGLRFTGAFSYLDATYDSTNPAFTLRDPVSLQFVDMTGKSLPFSPKFSATIGAEYVRTLPGLNGDLVLSASYDWQDDVFLDSMDRSEDAQKAYGLADARIAYRREDGRFEIAAFARNIFDEDYYITLLRGSSSVGGNTGQEGAPRTYGVQLMARY